MRINDFTDLDIWKKAKTITVHIYRLLKDNKDYGFKDQIQRASVSIMNNIAEGFYRPDRDNIKFQTYAKTSALEVRSMIYLGFDLKYFLEGDYIYLEKEIISEAKMISSFITHLKKIPPTNRLTNQSTNRPTD